MATNMNQLYLRIFCAEISFEESQFEYFSGIWKWAKLNGIAEIFTITGCILGVTIGIALELTIVYVYTPPLNVRLPESTISTWIGDGTSQITDGQMNQSDQVRERTNPRVHKALRIQTEKIEIDVCRSRHRSCIFVTI